MGIFDGLASMMADSAAKSLINKHIERYGKLKSLFIQNGEIKAGLILNGLSDREVAISCASVEIAEDGSSIRLGDFKSNVSCIEQALNDFCTRTFEVKSTPAQVALMGVRQLLF